MPKTKIFCFNNGGPSGWLDAIALAEDGVVVACHICSHEGFMQHDLGLTSNWKHELYDSHCGADNWELEWVPYDSVQSHEGLQAALRLNTENAKAEAASGDNPARLDAND